MALDFRNYGKKLTLEKCASLYEDFMQILTPLPAKVGVKGRIVVLPDEVWVTQWQQEHIFSSVLGNLENWRGIPIKVIGSLA